MPFLAVIAPTFLFVILGFLAFVISAAKRANRATEAAWVEAGARMKLAYRPKKGVAGGRVLEGPLSGYSVRINTFAKSHGNGSSTFTLFTLRMQPLGLGLELSPQHFISSITNSLKGGQDLTVGDAEFDKKVLVRSRSPHLIKGFLTPHRRRVIGRFLTDTRRAKITDDEITYVQHGVVKTADGLRLGINKVVADALQDSGERTSLQEAAEEFRNSGAEPGKPQPIGLGRNLDTESTDEFLQQKAITSTMGAEPPPIPLTPLASREAAQRRPSDPPSFPSPKSADKSDLVDGSAPKVVPAKEPLATPSPAPVAPLRPSERPVWQAPIEPILDMGKHSAPASLFENPSAPARAVEPAAEAAALAEIPAQAPPRTEPVEAEPTSGSSPADYLSLRAELFETSRMNSQTKELFEVTYAGREVSWSGKLRRISTYSSDFVFKDSVGAKAIIELEGIPDGSFTKGVQAVVQLPTEAATEFGQSYDIAVAFTGKLHSCDGFLRDIFIEAGSLTATE
jgi:hypothetical protein